MLNFSPLSDPITIRVIDIYDKYEDSAVGKTLHLRMYYKNECGCLYHYVQEKF